MYGLTEVVKALIRLKARHVRGFSLADVSPAFILHHAREELLELHDAPDDMKELGDLIGVLAHYAVKKQWGWDEIEKAIYAKWQQRVVLPADINTEGFWERVRRGLSLDIFQTKQEVPRLNVTDNTEKNIDIQERWERSREQTAVNRRVRELFGSGAQWPLLLWFEEKHGRRLFVLEQPADGADAGIKVLTERIEEGHWYLDADAKLAADALAESKLALGRFNPLLFLMGRAEYEYESVRIEFPERVS